jgi:hypothetical protein
MACHVSGLLEARSDVDPESEPESQLNIGLFRDRLCFRPGTSQGPLGAMGAPK